VGIFDNSVRNTLCLSTKSFSQFVKIWVNWLLNYDSMKTKEDFHNLIEKIEDEEILKGYFKLIQRLNNNQSGDLWDGLSLEEREELLLSYDESFDPKNLLSHEDVKKQHEKWLGK